MNRYNNPLDRVTDIRTGHIICSNCFECINCGTCTCGKSTFDFAHLEHAIRNMSDRSKLYNLIKEVIKDRGHWKNKTRDSYKRKL